MGMYVKGAEWEIVREITLGNVKFIGKLAPLTAGGFAPKVEFDTGVRQSSGVVGTEVLVTELDSKSELGKLVADVIVAATNRTNAAAQSAAVESAAAPVFPTTAAPVFNVPTTTTAPGPKGVAIGTELVAADGTTWRVIADGLVELVPQ